MIFCKYASVTYIVQFQNGGCVIIFLAISLNFHRIDGIVRTCPGGGIYKNKYATRTCICALKVQTHRTRFDNTTWSLNFPNTSLEALSHFKLFCLHIFQNLLSLAVLSTFKN